jgi:hypothetical protein
MQNQQESGCLSAKALLTLMYKKTQMKALIVIDVQNEFSRKGKRPVSGHAAVIDVIREKDDRARVASLMEILSMTR